MQLLVAFVSIKSRDKNYIFNQTFTQLFHAVRNGLLHIIWHLRMNLGDKSARVHWNSHFGFRCTKPAIASSSVVYKKTPNLFKMQREKEKKCADKGLGEDITDPQWPMNYSRSSNRLHSDSFYRLHAQRKCPFSPTKCSFGGLFSVRRWRLRHRKKELPLPISNPFSQLFLNTCWIVTCWRYKECGLSPVRHRVIVKSKFFYVVVAVEKPLILLCGIKHACLLAW